MSKKKDGDDGKHKDGDDGNRHHQFGIPTPSIRILSTSLGQPDASGNINGVNRAIAITVTVLATGVGANSVQGTFISVADANDVTVMAGPPTGRQYPITFPPNALAARTSYSLSVFVLGGNANLADDQGPIITTA
jgi:hypothetical protein